MRLVSKANTLNREYHRGHRSWGVLEQKTGLREVIPQLFPSICGVSQGTQVSPYDRSPRPSAFLNQTPFELCQRRKDVEHELAACSCREKSRIFLACTLRKSYMVSQDECRKDIVLYEIVTFRREVMSP